MKSIFFVLVLVVIYMVTGLFIPVMAISEPFAYFDTHKTGIGEFEIFSDQVRYKLGDKMQLKYAVRAKNKSTTNVKLQIYRVGSYFTNYDYMSGCIEYEDIHLLKTIDLPTYSTNVFFEGSTSIPLTIENGFFISNINESIPLDYSENREKQNRILVKVVDTNSALIDYADVGMNVCKYDKAFNFFVDSPDTNYPDLIVQNVSISKNPVSFDSNTVITFVVKNVGLSASTKKVKVCLAKRNIIEDGKNPIWPVWPVKEPSKCQTVDALEIGESKTYNFDVDADVTIFSKLFSDRSSENDKLSIGQNRLALVINPSPNTGIAETSYDNNEYVFNLAVNNGPNSLTNNNPVQVQNPQQTESNNAIKDGDVLKSPSHPSVYYYENGKRRPFVNEAVYKTWFTNFSNVKKISVEQMEEIALGNPMPIKPGVKLLKFPFNPKIYEVLEGEAIKHITSEKNAENKYGRGWASMIIELPEIYYLFYIVR